MKVHVLLGLLLTAPLAAAEEAEPVPVLVELYTSQGCSSCPPADKVLAELQAEQPVPGVRVVPLSLHVDYWNRLGWADPYSSPSYSARQHGYADSTGRRYTPQMVVDGTRRFIGSSKRKAKRAIAEAAALPKAAVSLEAERLPDGRVRLAGEIGALPAASGEVLVSVAVTENGLATQVRRGENAGRRLAHASIVRELRTLGSVPSSGYRGETVLELEGSIERSRIVLFAQETGGRRRVLAVGVVDLDELPAAQ